MDLLPDLNDLEIVAPEDLDEVMIGGEIVNDLNSESTQERETDLHEDVFGKEVKQKVIEKTPELKTKTKKEHLDSVRAKSVEARWGTKEARAKKKADKAAAVEARKEVRRIKRETKAEENREKARKRYWDKKAEMELKERQTFVEAPKEEFRHKAPEQFTYSQFSRFMDERDRNKATRKANRPPPSAPVAIPPKIVYQEKIVYKEATPAPLKYPSIFSHIEF
tara:strand:- start:2182 stop:2847 length:666 start_codon:yes stop_codon:yes gene_type:complete